MSTRIRPSDPPPKDDSIRWELDIELTRLDVQRAWSTLVEHQCDPLALKSALYYAEQYLAAAYEMPEKLRGYSRTRGYAVNLLIELEKTLQQFMEMRAFHEQMVDQLLLLRGVKKKEIAFLKDFPAMLKRIRRILKIINIPKRIIPNRLKDWLSGVNYSFPSTTMEIPDGYC